MIDQEERAGKRLCSKKVKTPSKYEFIYKELCFSTWFLRNKDLFNISKANKDRLFTRLGSEDEARVKRLYKLVSNFLMHSIIQDMIENNNIFILPNTKRKGKIFIGTTDLYRKVNKKGRTQRLYPNFLTDGKAYTTHLQLSKRFPKHYRFRLGKRYRWQLKDKIEGGKIYFDQERIESI